MKHTLEGIQPERKERMESMTRPGGTDTHTTGLRLDAHDDQLLPGIPNEITLDRITSKLPWRTFYTLSSVSPAWLYAIRSRQVFNARVRTNSTETLALLDYETPSGSTVLCLYSMRENYFLELCLLMDIVSNALPACERVKYMDGKVYVLGAGRHRGDDLICVLDLAGQKGPEGWKEYASTEQKKRVKAWGVMDGKIYLFGVTKALSSWSRDRICDSQVYDPKKDTWSLIKPIPSLRSGHHVTTVGEELVVHGGHIFVPDFLKFPLGAYVSDVSSLEIYHPSSDEWRVVDPIVRSGQSSRTAFLANGKLHSITRYGVDVFDSMTNSWTNVHSHWSMNFASRRTDALEISAARFAFHFHAVQTVDNELLGTVTLQNRDGEQGNYLVRSIGLGSGNNQIAWHEVLCPRRFRNPLSLLRIGICSIQL